MSLNPGRANGSCPPGSYPRQSTANQQVYYQCSICKVFLDSKTKLKQHKNKRHSVGESLNQRNAMMEETTADLVKLRGKRQYLRESQKCTCCKKLIFARYNCYLISEQKKDTFSEYFACQRCFFKLIKQKPV